METNLKQTCQYHYEDHNGACLLKTASAPYSIFQGIGDVLSTISQSKKFEKSLPMYYEDATHHRNVKLFLPQCHCMRFFVFKIILFYLVMILQIKGIIKQNTLAPQHYVRVKY